MDATEAREILADLDRLQRKRAALIEELRLWIQLKAQGYGEDVVAAVGWDEGLLTPNEKALAGRSDRKRPVWAGSWRLNTGRPCWYNFVRLKTGEVRRLSEFIEAPKGE